MRPHDVQLATTESASAACALVPPHLARAREPSVTDAGRAHVDEHREALGSPWEQASAGIPRGMIDVGKSLAQVAHATKQVMHAGTEAQVAEAAKVLAETRRSLYRILAEDTPADE